MKKYKKILAALLAVNLTINGMFTGVVGVSASAESQTNKDTEEKTEEVNTDDKTESTEKTETETKEEADGKESDDATKSDDAAKTEETDKKTEETKDTSSEKQEKEQNASENTIQEQDETINEVSTQANNNSTIDLSKLSRYNSNSKTMEITKNQDLILLSNCDPKAIQNITINFTNVGEVDVTAKSKIEAGTNISEYFNDETQTADRDYTYQGIGSEEVPFCGKIAGIIPQNFKIDNSFFGGLSSSAKFETTNKTITWCGDGSVPMIAKVYQLDTEAESHTLPITIKGDTSATMGSLIGMVKASDEKYKTQTLTIGQDTVTYGNNSVKVNLASDNAGLICGTLESGTICLDEYAFPTGSTTVTSETGHAGGLIGEMKEGTKLEIKSQLEGNKIGVTSSKNAAGGLVGCMPKGSKIVTGENATVKLSGSVIKGNTAAGGVAGTATDVAFDENDLQAKITIENPTVKAPVSGGMIGKYTLNASSFEDTSLQLPKKIELASCTLTAMNDGIAGGYFGELDLKGTLTYQIGETGTTKKEISLSYQECSDTEAVGGIIGKVISDKIASILQIQNMKVTATNSSGQGIQYHGGLIGELGEKSKGNNAVYLKVSNAEIQVTTPQAKEQENAGFGGLVGLLAQGSILQAEETIKVGTGDTVINRGGGIVGYAEKSVLNLTGTTDLSAAQYENGSGKAAKTGWLVGYQDSALLYANGDGNGNGWKYIRGKENGATKQAMNDIGNYGQIIRLKFGNSASKLSSDLITISDAHEAEYTPKTEVVSSDAGLSIGSEDAFALLSIAWNTRGYFGGITGITSENFSASTPKLKNITITADIDLTGSGITGLTRDTYSNEDCYTGTLDGQKHTITLASGETFGYKQDKSSLAQAGDDGYGEVIAAGSGNDKWHGRQGIFAVMVNATVQNLTVDGNIWISNAGQDILAGGIAGEIGKYTDWNKRTTTILGVTVKETITADCAVNQLLMVGGFFGGTYNSNTILTLQKSNNIENTEAATISIVNCTSATDDTKINAGGVVGEVGEGSFTLNAESLNVKNSITTDAKKRAYVGGLIGVIKGNNGKDNYYANHTINIKDVVFDGFQISAPSATEVCGGLLGSVWMNVEVFFAGEGEKYGLDVKNDTKVVASNAENVGGLAYRSSGKWEIQSKGINLESLTINAKTNLGLLVCKGDKEDDKVAGSLRNVGALYLSTTKHWNDSYGIGNVDIQVSDAGGVFDEFVAYTASSATNITTNSFNGVISIATKEVTQNGNTSRVGVDVSECTTYQNRTTYGRSHKTNACSRYYYDLDQCFKDVGAENGRIDTPQELLLWSVHQYASENIRKYFGKTTDISKKPESGPWEIGNGTDTEHKVSFDMSSYSYYPIKKEAESINIRSAEIKFANETIETKEKNKNKSTQGTESNHTQHYGMHCGLLYNFQTSSLTVSSVIFSGSIGKINNATSGVLVSNFAGGNLEGTKVKSAVISISDIVLDGLKVTDCGNEYAPLLINNIGDNSGSKYTYGYTTLTVDGVTTQNYTYGNAVASSLIGKVGSYKAYQINMSFQNIELPDKKADGTTDGGLFSHATLLEHFSYHTDDTASGGTYIFYKADDWDKDSQHSHKVTYGKEITESIEFPDLQKWYYDEDTYEKPEGLVYNDINNKESFSASAYLPYVYTAYDKKDCMHEIKVNQRVTDILKGCGTYGHPYQITSEKEMKILAEYMATANPRKDWRVTVTRDQNTYHADASDNSKTDVTYQYDGTYWAQVENKKTSDNKDNWQYVKNGDKNITIGKEFMHQYLLNAYYDLQGTLDATTKEYQLKLTDFDGFGTKENPFRGVITSVRDKATTVILNGEKTSNGLIPYSYGSVIKNLKISYKETGKTLTWPQTTTTSGQTYYPEVCFGGVIGCILGGDNIIDDVTVSMSNNWLALSGDKKYLIQIGGYVGSVSGGGVIFRNMTDETGLTADKIQNITDMTNESTHKNLYMNPYVGRVLDGYAFYEKTATGANVVDSLNNTNKNYWINTLSASDYGCIAASENTVNVVNSKGLLLLSAVVNSGAASNGNSNAYSTTEREKYPVNGGTAYTYQFAGKYGKVRNASYASIGSAVEATTDEAKSSKSDDLNVPGNTALPYLIQKYCSASSTVFGISTNSNIEINLTSDSDYDMTEYKKGYQGIGARYVSNAVLKESVDNPTGVVPELKSFNGKDKKVILSDMNLSEYADDDFPTTSAGEIFNTVRVANGGTISNLVISKSDSASTAVISLKYYDDDGSEKEASWQNNKKEVGLGGFAGSLVGYSDENANRDITISGIQVNGLNIDSPASAGGILGNAGKSTEKKQSNIAILLQPQDSQITYGISFNGCSYENLTITGNYAAGGFAGYVGNTNQNPKSSVTGFVVTETGQKNTGVSSAISATDNTSYAGGLFGYVGTRIFINMEETGAKKSTKTTLQNVSVSAGKEVGGCIGHIEEKCYGINNVDVKGIANTKNAIIITGTSTGTFYAGGVVGYAKGTTQNWTTDWTYAGGISNCTVEQIKINNTEIAQKHNYKDSGKIATNYIAGGMVGQTAGGQTRIEDCEVRVSEVYGSVAGGINGQTDSQMEFVNCKTQGSLSDAATTLSGFSTAGGLLGFWTGGQSVTIQDCKIQFLNVEGKDWGVGALIGDADGGGVGTLYLFNTSVKDASVTAAGNQDNAGGRWPCVGSIIGNLRNTIKASNVLLYGITLNASNGSKSNATKGLLFGKVNDNAIAINIAGISIQNTSGADKLAGSGNVDTDNDYIAFADYSGAESSSTDLLLPKNVKASEPYVATSPKSELYVTENGSPKYLYGDGAVWETSKSDEKFTMRAQNIWNNKGEVTDGHYAYSKITNNGKDDSVSSFDFSNIISTYNTNQLENEKDTDGKITKKHQADSDFPVVQVSNGNADVIKDYLNIVTNGGFSAANTVNNSEESHVTAKSEVYIYKDGKFVKTEDSPALQVNTDNNKKITFEATTDHDNESDRFTLVTVTFTEDGYSYQVFVPVLVRRMLEVQFSATLSYGTNFRSENYKNLNSHVLESFGSSITAYLTYTYNSDEKGVYTQYGWESYINAGGDAAAPMERDIEFVQGDVTFPKGTQLSLIDCKDDRVYYYTVGDNPENNVSLQEFKDSDGKAYEPPSIAELMKATAVSDKSGSFIKVDANGKPDGATAEDDKTYSSPTVRIWNETSKQYEYYRKAESGETGKYKITVNEGNLKDANNKSLVGESYYLVITVPKSDNNVLLNGSLQTSINNTEIPDRIHYMNLSGEDDDHNNTASTYLISKGYQQKLTEENITDLSKKMSEVDSTMKIDIVDEITFPNGQAYLDGDETGKGMKDELYQRFVGSLQKTVDNKTSAEQFPSGTTGTANFYVYTKDGDKKYYYKYTNDNWEKAGTDETVATSYTWTSDGGNMELPLANDTIDNLVSLQGVRNLVRGAKRTGNSTFYVEVKMDATIPALGLDVIPESDDKTGSPSDYTKLAYSSQVSTEKTSLIYSTNRAFERETYTSYYRAEPAGAKLNYEADQIGQLGINLLDLQYLDTAEEHSLIDTTAIYDLSSMKNLKDVLENSQGIKFTLSLTPKNTSDKSEEYQQAVTDANKYLSIELKSEDSGQVKYENGVWSWTVPKSTYWSDKDEGVKTDSVFNGSTLTQAIQLKVNVNNVQDENHYYSNYKVVLTAEILEDDNSSTGKVDDNIIYTLAKIKPEFVNE